MATNKNTNNIRVQWAILCQNATVDQQSNNLSIFNVIEEVDFNKTVISNAQIARSVEIIDLPEKTKIAANFSVVVMLDKIGMWGTDTQAFLRITTLNPDGDIVAKNELQLSTKDTEKRLRVIFGFDAMIIDKSGTYIYSVQTRMGRDKEFTKQYETAVEVRVHP